MNSNFNEMIKILKASINSKEKEKESTESSLKTLSDIIDCETRGRDELQGEILELESDANGYEKCKKVNITSILALLIEVLCTLYVLKTCAPVGYQFLKDFKTLADLVWFLIPSIGFIGASAICYKSTKATFKIFMDNRKLQKKYASLEELEKKLAAKREMKMVIDRRIAMYNANKEGLERKLEKIEFDLNTLRKKLDETTNSFVHAMSTLEDEHFESMLNEAYLLGQVSEGFAEIEGETQKGFSIQPKEQ